MKVSRFNKAFISAAMVVFAQSAMAESTEEWGRRALELQANLDAEVPLAKTTWVGSHNSFANPQDDTMSDYNQPFSLKNQMRKGVRELVFDVHWDVNQMVLCHNNTSESCLDGTTGRRKLTYALDDIKQWLNEADNKDQVILLKLEMTDKARRNINKVESKILGSMGSYVYRPDREPTHGDLNLDTGCTALPSATLTKKKVLDAGKNVILFNTHGCISDGGFNDLVFYGDDNLGNVNSTDKLNSWSQSKKDSVVSRAKDAMTRDESYMTGANSVKIQPSNVNAWMRAGLNIFELYGFDANDSRWDKQGQKPVQAEHMVWSWKNQEPNDNNGNEDCAMITSDGKFNDKICSFSISYACYSDVGGWLISDESGAWSNGHNVCAGYNKAFRVPTSLIELDALNAEIAASKGAGTYVWVNYTDSVVEGEWLANKTSSYLASRAWKTQASLGGSGGSAFDDFDLLHYDLYRNKRQVTKINMSAGNRVDKIGFEYSDGYSVSHGGNGYDRALVMDQTNEYIYKVEVCSAKHNGSYRIHYLRFETNYGDILEGGTRKGTCQYNGAWGGYEYFAMFGRSGNELDAVGFYLRRR